MTKLTEIKNDLQKLGSPEKASKLQRFFKTGKGDYGEGDVFVGVTVPEQRKIAKKHSNLKLKELEKLFSSKIHEHRLTALLILVEKFEKEENERERKKIFNFYFSNIKGVNNWDLVDLSAPKIVGNFLLNKEKKKLFSLINSKNLWERRIAIVSTFAFIKQGKLELTFKISKLLLNDKHDLIHKSVGWMLREAGKRNPKKLEAFLDKNLSKIPRTMLRYSIEKFPEKKRKYYLTKN